MKIDLSFRNLLIALSGVAGLTLPASAGFTNPHTPTWRGAPNTEFGGWESFSNASIGQNPPDDPNSTTLDASLVQLDTSAFLTAGNIYSFSAPLRCVLSNSVNGPAREVLLQVATRGSELDYANVRLEYFAPGGALHSIPWAQRTELARISLGGQSFAVETMFTWDLSSTPDAVDSFELRFDSAAASMSLDALLLDARYADAPLNYCTAKVNSLGCSPVIESSGVPSASLASGFIVSARDVMNNKPGLLLYSTSGRQAVPFGGGTLCLRSPIRRLFGQSSGGNPPPNDCSGTYAGDFNTRIASGLDPALVAGALVQFQYWSRDPGFPNGLNIGLTDALEATIQP